MLLLIHSYNPHENESQAYGIHPCRVASHFPWPAISFCGDFNPFLSFSPHFLKCLFVETPLCRSHITILVRLHPKTIWFSIRAYTMQPMSSRQKHVFVLMIKVCQRISLIFLGSTQNNTKHGGFPNHGGFPQQLPPAMRLIGRIRSEPQAEIPVDLLGVFPHSQRRAHVPCATLK